MVCRPIISIPGKLKQECLKPTWPTKLDPACKKRRGQGEEEEEEKGEEEEEEEKEEEEEEEGEEEEEEEEEIKRKVIWFELFYNSEIKIPTKDYCVSGY